MSEPPLWRARLAIDAHNHIGEGPVWDGRAGRLIWVDHAAGSIQTAVAADGGWRERARLQLGGHVAAALPRDEGGYLIVGSAEIAWLDEAGRQIRVEAAPFAVEEMRFNEAKCDPAGRLWAGAMARDLSAGGVLLCYDGRAWTVALSGLVLPNGMDWSPDGRTFYLVDSIHRTLDAYAFDPESGALAERRTLASFHDLKAAPNGMAVDCEGCLWVALTCAGRVVRLSPKGERLSAIACAAPGVTSCAFGGAALETLFITSRSGRLPEFVRRFGLDVEVLERLGEDAGGLFVCEPGVVGRAGRLCPL